MTGPDAKDMTPRTKLMCPGSPAWLQLPLPEGGVCTQQGWAPTQAPLWAKRARLAEVTGRCCLRSNQPPSRPGSHGEAEGGLPALGPPVCPALQRCSAVREIRGCRFQRLTKASFISE